MGAPKYPPPASGWKAGHRAPGDVTGDNPYMPADYVGGFYGQLDGVAYGTDPMDRIPTAERRAFPDCDQEGY